MKPHGPCRSIAKRMTTHHEVEYLQLNPRYQCLRYSAKYPVENRVNMLGVIAHVELLTDFFFGKCSQNLVITEKLGEEILVLIPDLHGIALHQAVRCFPVNTRLRKRGI